MATSILPGEAPDRPQEECAVFGVFSTSEDVARLTYFGLQALQHRGQESAGIAVGDGNTVVCMKDLGLVTDEALRTYGELYPEDYQDYVDDIDYGEYVEKYGTEVMEEAGPASVGVIGGADGPTTVVVAGVTA